MPLTQFGEVIETLAPLDEITDDTIPAVPAVPGLCPSPNTFPSASTFPFAGTPEIPEIPGQGLNLASTAEQILGLSPLAED